MAHLTISCNAVFLIQPLVLLITGAAAPGAFAFPMTLQQLEYLVALGHTRQFQAAADACFVTQPALSMQVQKLEAELGVVLFERGRRGVTPTPIGLRVIERARAALRVVAQLREEVAVEKGEEVGELRLGVIPTLAPYVLPGLLGAVTAAYPRLRVRIEELQTAELTARLLDHRLDIGLLSTPLDERALRELPVIDEPFLLYLNPDHPLATAAALPTPAALNAAELWLLQQGHCFRSQVVNLCGRPNDSARRLTYESGSLETLQHLVRQHGGYTLVPELAVRAEVDRNPWLRRFAPPEPVREISLVVHHTFVRLPLLEFLRTALLAQVPARLHARAANNRIRWQ